jgi:PQQ-like domain
MEWTWPNDAFVPLRHQNDVVVCAGGTKGIGVRDLNSGNVVWSSVNHMFGCGSWTDYIVALDHGRECIDLLSLETGREAHRLAIPGNRAIAVRTGGDRAFVDVRTVRCANLLRGVIEWERDIASEVEARPGFQPIDVGPQAQFLEYAAGSLPDVMVGYFGNSTLAFSGLDGHLLWMTANIRGTTGICASGGRIYGMYGEEFWILDEASGELVSRSAYPKETPTKLLIRERPALHYRNRVAVPFETGLLAIFSADDGKLVNEHRSKHALWRAAEAGGRLFIGTGSGKVLVFDEKIWAL